MNKKIKILIFVTGILFLSLVFLVIFKFFIQADTNAVIIRGTIFLGLGDSVSKTPAPGVTVTAMDYKGTRWDTITNQYGQYTFVIDKPVGCNYKIYLSGTGYNAKEAGTINVGNVIKNPRQVFNYFADSETDLMWSNYFNGAYPSGYADNFYHFSKWDYYYVKNLTTLDQIINKKSPTAANFEVPIETLKPGPVINMANDNIWVTFQVLPVTKNWMSSQTIPVGKPVYTLKKKLSSVYADGKVKFDFSLDGLDQNTRYQSYINGFRVVTGFYVADTNGNPISDPNSGYMNPDLRIYRSEDGKVVKVNYTGLETMPEDIFVEPVAAPTEGRNLSSDFGYRLVGQGWHEGLDFTGGSSVYAVNPGQVEYVNNSICGVGVRINHANNIQTVYCHLDKVKGRTVPDGAQVCTGQKIGVVDNSGQSTGTHLHFGIKKVGFIDPFPYFNQFVNSIDALFFKGWKNRDHKNHVNQPYARPK